MSLLPSEQRLREALEKMTPGRLEVRSVCHGPTKSKASLITENHVWIEIEGRFEDIEGLCSARNEAPLLLARMERLRGLLRERMEKCNNTVLVHVSSAGGDYSTTERCSPAERCDLCRRTQETLEEPDERTRR